LSEISGIFNIAGSSFLETYYTGPIPKIC